MITVTIKALGWWRVPVDPKDTHEVAKVAQVLYAAAVK